MVHIQKFEIISIFLAEWVQMVRVMNDENNKHSSLNETEAAIRQAITTGKLVPGQRLVEIDLMTEFNVSRGHIRKAFRNLESEGIITIEKNRGASVKKISRQEFLDTIEVLNEITRMSCKKVALRANEPTVKKELKKSLQITRTFENELSKHNKVQDYMQHNVRFWGCIGALSGNPVLEAMRIRLQLPLLRLHTHGLMLSSSRSDWVVNHQELLQALIEGDVRKSDKLVAEAQKSVWKAIMELPDSVFV